MNFVTVLLVIASCNAFVPLTTKSRFNSRGNNLNMMADGLKIDMTGKVR